jgi:hypothetical protein
VTSVRSPRALLVACAGLAAAAVLLWGASAAVWSGERTGAQVTPSLTGVALLALAGVAGVVATAGVLRRLVGVLLAAAGTVEGVVALQALVSTADGTAAPLLAVAGSAVLLAVGVLVLLREPRLPRFGARYAAPGDRRVELDPDRAAWQALDAGRDPTADLPEDAGDDPGDGPQRGRG